MISAKNINRFHGLSSAAANNLSRVNRTIPSGNRVNIQASLTIGQHDDQYEREADRVADRVMSMNPSAGIQNECPDCQDEEIQMKPLYKTISSLVQMQPVEEEEDAVQTKMSGMEPGGSSSSNDLEEMEDETIHSKSIRKQDDEIHEEEEEVQPKYSNVQINNEEKNNGLAWLKARLNASGNDGERLPVDTKMFMETRFGSDFSDVSIHNDPASDEMNRRISARAFTTGNHIYFKNGQYNPGTGEGKKLLAHELTHVIQQGDHSSKKASGKTGKNIIRRKPTKLEQKVFDLVNDQRSDKLVWNNKLHNTSRAHSAWMQKEGKLEHKKNLKFKGFSLVGENIAQGQTTAAEVVSDWMKSPLHKANIERAEFEVAAIGIKGKGGNRYYTQHFGSKAPRGDFRVSGQKQKGTVWTNSITGKVSDNIDSPDKLIIKVEKVSGEIKKLPVSVTADKKGQVAFDVITEGMESTIIKIILKDTHGQESEIQLTIG